MSNVKKIVLGALSLLVLAGSASAAAPGSLGRAEMNNIRGESSIGAAGLKKQHVFCPQSNSKACHRLPVRPLPRPRPGVGPR